MENLLSETQYKFKNSYGGIPESPEPQTPQQDAPLAARTLSFKKYCKYIHA
jgi:hypothetical protein